MLDLLERKTVVAGMIYERKILNEESSSEAK